MEKVQAEFAGAWGAKHAFIFFFFLFPLGTGKVVKQKSRGGEKVTSRKKKGLKTIYLEVTYPFSRPEKYQLNLHSYSDCMNKSKTFN